MITRQFIEDIHGIFDELNYQETNNLDFDDFMSNALDTLDRCETIEDAKTVLSMIDFCLERWNGIEQLFKNALDKYNEYVFEGTTTISLIGEEESCGIYYVTNFLDESNDIQVFGASLDYEPIYISCRNDCFSLDESEQYRLSFAQRASDMMKIFDKDGNCICNIVYDGECFSSTNNSSSLEILDNGEAIFLIDREYLNGLGEDEEIDSEKIFAKINWDIIDEKRKKGISQIALYIDKDFELILLFSVVPFLLFRKYINNQFKKLRNERMRQTLRTAMWASLKIHR